MSITSKTRITAAMNLAKPDRVPLMCQFSIGFMMQQLKPDPSVFWYDKKVFADGLITLCNEFKFDGILVSLHGHSDKWKDNLISSEKIDEGKVLLKYTDRTELHSWPDLPVVEFKQNKVVKNIDDIDIEKDVPSNIDYIPVSHNLYFDLDKDGLFDVFDYIHDKVGDSVSIHGEVTSPFDYFLDLLGYENGLVSLILNPEKCLQILEKYTDGVIEIATQMCAKPIDAIKISSPFAGEGFISTEFYAQFVLPFEQRLVKAIRDSSKHVYIHTCGSIGDRLELMRDSGISGLECLDPVPVGNVDLSDAFNRVGKDLFIKGNIDSVNSLLLCDDNKAREDVLKIIEIGKSKGSGFILSTACSVAPLVKKEKLLMLSELISTYGKY